jgi:hypothetical protein
MGINLPNKIYDAQGLDQRLEAIPNMTKDQINSFVKKAEDLIKSRAKGD